MSKKKAAKKSAKKAPKKPAPKAVKKAPAKNQAKTSSGQGDLGKFNWNELMTSDVDGAKAFYTQLLGWKAKPFGQGMDYTILENKGVGAGGLMKCPEGASTMWLAYVSVADIDATVARVTKLGGRVCKPPFPIPGVGRIAFVLDPQGAMFGLHSC